MGSTIHHPVFARVFSATAGQADRAGMGRHRAELLAGVSGRVIELGAGCGSNFGYYPAPVTGVLAVEPEPYLRRRAARAAAGAPVPVTVVDGVGSQLPAGDATFDAGVCSIVLCSVPDQARALAELYRVIRPGGELRFYEHVRAAEPGRARTQDRVDRVWAALTGGCHPNRDTGAAIAAAGFRMRSCREFEFRLSRLSAPASPHILGVAARP